MKKMLRRTASLLLMLSLCMGFAVMPAAAQTEVIGETLTLDASGYGMCAVCNERVKWTGVKGTAGTSRVGDSQSGHFYLSGDVILPTNVNNFANAKSGGTVCLHLNGKNLTYSSRTAIAYDNSTINIMGKGNITAKAYTGTSTNNYAPIYVGAKGTLNIYGGTWTTTDSTRPLALVNKSTGNLKVYSGAVLDGTVRVTAGTLFLEGDAKATTIEVGASGKLNVDQSWTQSARVSFDTIADGVVPVANGYAAGAFSGSLRLPSGELLQLQNNQFVTASGVGKLINTKATQMDFTKSTTQYCPICCETVQWTDITTLSLRRVAKNTGHFYYSKDCETGSNVQNFVNTPENGTVCINLNGKTVSYASRIAGANANATVNIMGNGNFMVVPITVTTTDQLAGMYFSADGATLNLYGGSWNTTDGDRPLLILNHAGAAVNVYPDVTLDNSQLTYLKVNKGTLNLYGGTVTGGKAEEGGNIYVGSAGRLNVHSGTITGGSASTGGNIYIAAGGNADISAGTVSLGDATAGAGGNIAVAGSVNIGEGAVISDGTATGVGGNIAAINTATVDTCGTITGGTTTGEKGHGGNISITTGGTLNITGGSISGGTASYQGGNVRVYSGTLNMSGGTVFGGTASTGTNHNVWLAGNAVMTMTGGEVKGIDGTQSNGTAIDIGNDATLYLGGTAVVSNDIRKGNIRMATTAVLNVLNDWKGEASVRWLTQKDYSEQIDPAQGQCGSLKDGVFTPGGSYEGELFNEYGTVAKILGQQGNLIMSPDHNGDGVTRILGIGNSYTIDSMHLLYEVYQAESPDTQISMGFLYYSGCNLSQHVGFIQETAAEYVYYKLDNATGKWVQTPNSTMLAAVKDELWDIVTLQQSSANSGKPETYNADIQTIQNFVSGTLGYTPEFLWNMTWAYAPGYNNSYYVDNGVFSQEVMYKAITDTVQEKIVSDSSFTGVIPTGTAIQNARTYYTDALEISRPDLTHLTNLGRYIAAYTWYGYLTGKMPEIPALTQLPSYLRINWGTYVYSEVDTQIVAKSVAAALSNPFAVTKVEPDDRSNISFNTKVDQTQVISVCKPEQNETVRLSSETLDSFLTDYYLGKGLTVAEQVSQLYKEVEFSWNCSVENQGFTLIYTTQRDFSDAICVETQDPSVTVSDLYVAKTYYWQVVTHTAQGDVYSKVSTFYTADTPRVIEIDGTPNTRDLGGYLTEDGKYRVKQGLVYRGAKMDAITEAGIEKALNTYKILVDLDLRNASDSGFSGVVSPLGDGARYVNIQGQQYATAMQSVYGSVMKEEIAFFANPDNYPVLFHCASGRDRTGTLAFLLGALLGVPEENLYADFELTYMSERSYAVGDTRGHDWFVEFLEIFHGYEGDTAQQKAENICLSVGVTDSQIRTIRHLLLEENTFSRDQSVMVGDVNGDAVVDGMDATLLLQYAAGWDVTIEMAEGDANGDGTVDGMDATLLLQYAAGWDVTLG